MSSQNWNCMLLNGLLNFSPLKKNFELRIHVVQLNLASQKEPNGVSHHLQISWPHFLSCTAIEKMRVVHGQQKKITRNFSGRLRKNAGKWGYAESSENMRKKRTTWFFYSRKMYAVIFFGLNKNYAEKCGKLWGKIKKYQTIVASKIWNAAQSHGNEEMYFQWRKFVSLRSLQQSGNYSENAEFHLNDPSLLRAKHCPNKP